MSVCPNCGSQMNYIQQYGQWYCYNCRQYQPQYSQPQQRYSQYPTQPMPYQQPQPEQAQYQQSQPQYVEPPMQPVPPSNIWYQNFYRIRKKVLTIGNKYWLEDYNGNILGFSMQKLFKLKEDIRIYSDENMMNELFSIKQQQILDIWGTFAVVDSRSNTNLGYIKRKALSSSFIRDEWEIYDAYNRLIGGIYESTGRGLARKYLPGGSLIPEKVTWQLHGQPVAEINQQFKIIGDIWEMNCINVPQYLDRRVLLSCILLMGMIERARK